MNSAMIAAMKQSRPEMMKASRYEPRFTRNRPPKNAADAPPSWWATKIQP
jgi:hypothetical protein